MTLEPLPPSAFSRTCDPQQLPFANTSELERAAGGDVLWPEGNKTVGGLAAVRRRRH